MVDLTVSPGERVAIVGAPGSGKTTLLLVAAGALRCDAGSVQAVGSASMALQSLARRCRARGVAEQGIAGRAGREVLTWTEPRRTQLIVARSLRDLGMPVDRVLRLDAGQLHDVGVRVDSPSGPP
jgi:ABC-type taurine transport system ATPase subunit